MHVRLQTGVAEGSELKATKVTRVHEETGKVIPMTLAWQLGVAVVVSGFCLLFFSRTAAISALLGGMTAVVPNAFLAARLLRPDSNPQRILQRVWIGEIGKWILTAVLFAGIFAGVRPLAPAAVFGGFIAAQFVMLGALLVNGRADTKAT